MKAVIQRVAEARVEVGGRVVGQIGPGVLALVAVEREDGAGDVEWMARKLVELWIFRKQEKHFDIDVREAGGGVLLVSNFTVAGATRKGRRPSFDGAAPPETGRVVFDQLVERVKLLGVTVATGEFGADMRVSLINDGPATFVLESGVQS